MPSSSSSLSRSSNPKYLCKKGHHLSSTPLLFSPFAERLLLYLSWFLSINLDKQTLISFYACILTRALPPFKGSHIDDKTFCRLASVGRALCCLCLSIIWSMSPSLNTLSANQHSLATWALCYPTWVPEIHKFAFLYVSVCECVYVGVCHCFPHCRLTSSH